MKKPTQYLLVGCGSGCLLIVVAVVALIAGGMRMTKKTLSGFEGAVEARQALEQRFGEATDFTPRPDGAVPPERMEAFLAVRQAAAPVRERVVEAFSALPVDPEQAKELDSKPFLEKMRSVLDITKSSFGLGAEMGHFYEARNQALLEEGMGLGEYTYVYAMAYYVLLGHPIDDRGQGFPMPNVASQRLTRELAAMLRNQLAALGEDADAAWRERLEGEVAALGAHPARLPWADGLPPAIAASLEPYRERLEASYEAETNPFELGRNRRKGRWGIQAE